MSSKQRGFSKNQLKKRSQNDDSKPKKNSISTDFDFSNTAIVRIVRNHGFCFEGKIVYTKSSNKFDSNVNIAYSRDTSGGGKYAYNNSRSKMCLVSLISITLPNRSIGTVDEWITLEHLNIYLQNNLINHDDYLKLSNEINRGDLTDDKKVDSGFIFDDSVGNTAPVGGGATNEEEIDLADL